MGDHLRWYAFPFGSSFTYFFVHSWNVLDLWSTLHNEYPVGDVHATFNVLRRSIESLLRGPSNLQAKRMT